MKPKKKTSGANPEDKTRNADIRNFFSSSPAGPTTTKSKPRIASSPFSCSGKRASGIGTPSTTAGTPPSSARSLANSTPVAHVGTPSSAAAAVAATSTEPTSNKRAATTALTPARARKTPPPRPSSSSSSQADVICLTGSPVAIRSQLDSASPGTAAASLLGLVKKENGPDRNSSGLAAVSAATAAPSVQMSGYFLEGPAVRAGGGGEGGGSGGSQESGDGEGSRNLRPARYALPLGEVVVGRDSVRDNSPANRHKLRIGIDKREEGVSRSQATLRVHVPAGRVLVVHKQGAINGIRIVRWAGSPGITKAEKVEWRANPAAAAKALRAGQLLQAGQQSYLYPGDTLQLDGFRSPASSTCSFVLHPLPRGWTAPPLRSASIGGASGSRPTTPVASPRKTLRPVSRKPSPVSAASVAGGSRGGAATSPAPSSSLPPRANSTGKTRAAAAARSPASARTASGATATATATATAAATASSAAERVPPSPAVDGDTVKKRLRMSLGGAGRSSSGAGNGGGGSIATPSSTAGRLDCPSPAETGAEAPASGATKRPRPEVEEADLASVAAPAPVPSPRKAASPRTPSRPARSAAAAAPGNASTGSSKRLKGAGTRAPAASGSAALPPAAGESSRSCNVSPAGATGAGAAATAATVAVAAAAAADGSPHPPAPKAPTTPRERAARIGEGDGGEGAHEGGPGATGAKWKKGDTVVLKARVSKGVNKLGGVAHVLSIFDDGTYLVKLSLGGAVPTRVSSDLLFSYNPSPEKAIRGRRSTSRRRDSGGYRGVDPSNGWISPSFSSASASSSSSPALSTDSSSRPRRTKKEGGSRSGSKAGEKAASKSGNKVGGKAASAREGKSGDSSVRQSSSNTAADGDADGDVDADVVTARPGDRARVLYDETDWYMATVVAVHRNASVTVRFDDGSDTRVTLAPGDAEVCADGALAPTMPVSNSGPPTPTSSRSRGGGSSNRNPRPSSRRRAAAAKNMVRALGPGGRVLREGDGLALTEHRAQALLDTAPERLVGLVYQEKHPGYGGWWETFVTEVSSKRIGDGGGGEKSKDDLNKLWPESVVVGQMEVSAAAGGAAAAARKGEEEPDFVYTRKTGSLLTRLRAWDKHREAEWEATLEKEREEEEAADAIAEAKPSPVRRAAKKEVPPASRPASRDGNKKAAAQVPAPKGAAAASTAAPSNSGSIAPKKAMAAAEPKHKTPISKSAAGGSASGFAAADAFSLPTTAEIGDGGPGMAPQGDEGLEEGEKRTTTVKQTKASIKKQKAAQKETADQRALPTCPFCCCEFYATDTQDEIDRHFSSCASRPKPTTAVVATSTPMPASLTSSLIVGIKGDELGTLVAAVAEFAARGMRPRVPFLDRIMQEIFKSRCHFQTEYLRRLMTSSLESFPECWEPLNWSRFEETLQELVMGHDKLALNARVTYVDIALDCLEASRRRWQQPQLFLGAGGDRDGRTAVKRCSQWAAKVWAQRHASVTSGAGRGSSSSTEGNDDDRELKLNARVCMAVSRALGEALEAFQMAGGAGGAGAGSSLPKELEGCQLVAVEVESHTDVGDAEGTARCRAGLMRSLGARPFCPTLAGVLLQNMPAQGTKGDVEFERLKALLRRQRARGVSRGGGGGAEEGTRSARVVGGAAARSASDMRVQTMEKEPSRKAETAPSSSGGCGCGCADRSAGSTSSPRPPPVAATLGAGDISDVSDGQAGVPTTDTASSELQPTKPTTDTTSSDSTPKKTTTDTTSSDPPCSRMAKQVEWGDHKTTQWGKRKDVPYVQYDSDDKPKGCEEQQEAEDPLAPVTEGENIHCCTVDPSDEMDGWVRAPYLNEEEDWREVPGAFVYLPVTILRPSGRKVSTAEDETVYVRPGGGRQTREWAEEDMRIIWEVPRSVIMDKDFYAVVADAVDMFDWEDDALEDRRLDLQGKNIAAKDIGAFLQSLDGLDDVRRLKIVNLKGNRVGSKNENMKPIDTLLTASSGSLTALNLCRNPLGEEQRHVGPLVALAKTLASLPRLKVLDISDCCLIGLAGHRYHGLNALGNTFAGTKNYLTHLRISDNGLHSEAALIVGGWMPSMKKLRYLDMSRNPLARDPLGQRSRSGFDPLCRGLRTVSHLRTLLLRDVGIDDGEAEAVASFLALSVRLEKLDLSENQIHVCGARYLAGALRSNGSLLSLLLAHNAIGNEGALLLAASVPHAASVVEIDMSSNGLTGSGSDGRVKEAFIEAALASVSIETLGLSGNDLPPADVEEVQEYASANVELRAVADAPESYDLWKTSSIVEACLVKKFDRLPPGVAGVLKSNATFVDEEGPMREAVLAASPLTKEELLKSSPGAVDLATKVKAAGPSSSWIQSAIDAPEDFVTLDGEGSDDGF
eukprot:g14187.t1